jgi:hypothetical protein
MPFIELPDLSSLTMNGVMTTPFAVLLELDTLRIVLLVLLGRVITALAICASQRDQSTHEFSFVCQLTRALNYTHEPMKLGQQFKIAGPIV